MIKRLVRFAATGLLAATLLAGCGSVSIGRRFPINPVAELKVGHDQKQDVIRKMGQPYRRFVDSQGHEVFTYVWADGNGAGQKCVIAFNKNNVVYLVEVAP